MTVIGYYVTCDDAVCEECFLERGRLTWIQASARWIENGGFEGWEAPLGISEDDASDTPTHCVECGRLIEHELTEDGYSYVAEYLLRAIETGTRSPVETMWRLHYAQYASDWPESLLLNFDSLPLRVHPAHAKHAQRLAEMES